MPGNAMREQIAAEQARVLDLLAVADERAQSRKARVCEIYGPVTEALQVAHDALGRALRCFGATDNPTDDPLADRSASDTPL